MMYLCILYSLNKITAAYSTSHNCELFGSHSWCSHTL